MEQATKSAADENSRRAKRARISLACTSCREHKTRCDGKKPVCSYCERRNPKTQVPCLYRNQARIRDSEDFQNLLQRIGQLEGELAAQKSSTSDQGLQTSRKRTLSPLSHEQAPYNESQTQTSTNDNIWRSLSVSGQGDLTGSDLPRGQTISKDTSIADKHQNPQLELVPDTTRQLECEKQPGHEDSQQTRELGTASNSLLTPRTQASQDNNEPYFYGESSTTTLMEEVHEMISPSVQGSSGHPRVTPSINSAAIYPRRENNIGTYFSSTPGERNHIKDFDLPPRSLADHLITSYFERVHILYPFLHRPTFESAYERLFAPANPDDSYGNCERSELVDAGLGSYPHSDPNSRVFYCAINAIFALSCQFSDMRIKMAIDAAKVYLDRAMALLLSTDLLDNGSVSLVQVLLLLCLHLQSTPLRNRLWNIIGMAVRTAQGLGLQGDDEDNVHSKGKSSIEIEIRRRVWYCCVMLDMTVSMTLRRNPMVSEGYMSPLPRALDDEKMFPTTTSTGSPQPHSEIFLTTFFIKAIKLSELTANLFKAVYFRASKNGQTTATTNKEGEEVLNRDFGFLMDFEASWNALLVSLPTELHSRKDRVTTGDSLRETTLLDPVSRCLERQRNVLHARLSLTKILLFRPVFLQFCHNSMVKSRRHEDRAPSNENASSIREAPLTMRSNFTNYCAMECFWKAKELIDLVYATHRTKSASAWWYSIFYTHISGTIIVLSRSCPVLVDAIGISDIDETWLRCQEILKNMAIYGAHASRCLSSLEDLCSRLVYFGPASSRLVESQKFPLFPEMMNKEQRKSNSNNLRAVADYIVGDETPGGLQNNGHSEPRNLNSWKEDDTQANPSIPQTEPEIDMAGILPWDVDFDQWWTLSIENTDFEGASWPEASSL